MSAFAIWITAAGLIGEIAFAIALVKTYGRKTRDRTEKFVAEITARREIERELAHMASFAEMSPTPIIETDVDQKIHYLNPAALSEFEGLERQGWRHPIFEGVPEVLQTLHTNKLNTTSRSVKQGNKIYDQRITLLDDGTRLRIYLNDITELKRVDQLKTDFVNMVSHELRSPLTTIQATIKMVFAEVLGPLSVDQKETLALTLKGIARLARLINDLLDVSKMEAGKLTLHYERAELRSLIEEVVQNFEPLSTERGLTLRAAALPEPLELFMDRDKMTQVFTNLIQNALKFTPQGGVTVGFDLEEKNVRCWVADTGPGIAAEHLPKLFGKFQQVGTASKGAEKGTGLGLSLCKGIVETHHGRIWAESKKGEGTRFIFLLPICDAAAAFENEVKNLLQEATDNARPLTLMRIRLWPTHVSLTDKSHDAASDPFVRLQTLVKSIVGSENAIVDRARSVILLALSEVSKSDAQMLATRVEREFLDTKTPGAAVQIQLAAFPEDGSLLEQLLPRLSTP